MRTGWWCLIGACLVLLLAACAAAPRNDGGIVGTGNRPDCEEQAKKDGVAPNCAR